MADHKKNHWNQIYSTKTPQEVSWTESKPETSLHFIAAFNVPKDAAIIDIGGGDSLFVDFLLEEGYQNISVLDISAKAIERAQKRLGEKAEKVTWIVSDITRFVPTETYDVWHDRAVFHFLTDEEDVKKYVGTASKAVKGYLAIGTFSKKGPLKCSGLEIRQYDEVSLSSAFEPGFEKITCFTKDHITPFETVQNFTFCSFKKKQ